MPASADRRTRHPPTRRPPTRRRFTNRLFAWHATAERPLLIRRARTPWEILVAEVMSQQTGIERVGPAWRRFVDTWDSPEALAGAQTHDLLAAWSGLGYNRRALALREAARRIVADHDGRVPRTVARARSASRHRTVHGARGRGYRLPSSGRASRRERPACREPIAGREPA